ncbi:PAS domain-containing sensor histidine kinase [Sphingobium boeckii]|uniref:histidine kinase n=1 Tax=Sphingobium boeckii TaxID=1082345 RepID=A0A7W9AK89_9SPHN|nr:PAS domain-containing sensor histidine kinase [Sphingobium boeckii]MBB5687202.1 signal transduction histidine kinase [Sphingobium boeckii]
MTGSPLMPLVAGLVMAAWLGGAAWALVTGLRMRRGARILGTQAEKLQQLLDSAPALPMMVRPDGRIEAPERLADWLGLARMPNFLADLTGADKGLTEDDAAGLARDVAVAQKSGKAFTRAARAQGSSRTLLIRGAAATSALSEPGGVILWFFDATESQAEIGRLGQEAARLARAFDALSGLIEASPFPMWHRGPDLRLTLVNSAYVKAVEGHDAADVIARGLELVETSGGRSPLALAASARDGKAVVTRTVPATISGERRMMRVVDVPLGDAGVAGYAIDIEETEQVRSAFKRFSDAQRDMLDLLSAGVAQFGPDRALAFSNQPFQRIFAMKPEWIADRPEFDRVLDRMRETGRIPESRDFPGWKAERREWFTVPEGVAEESWLLPGGTHLRVVAQPLPDGGLLLIFEDRTEEVQLASARDTLLRVRTATFDNLFEAVGVFAADGRLNLWNTRFRQVWDFEEDFLATHPRVDVLAEAAGERLTNPARASLIRELVRIATVERQQRSGRVALKNGKHYEFAAVPLPDGNALFTMLDISDSRQIERALRDRNEALEQGDKLKTAFVENMSYELRTPLTSIGGFAEMLKEGYAGPLEDRAVDYVAAILESVARLGLLIDGVLDLTQSQAGVLPLELQPVNLIAMAQEAAKGFTDAAATKSIDFAVDLDPSLGGIRGDAKRLRQAIEHLLEHAIAGTAAGGRVLLHGSGDDRMARIVVSDNGRGMSAAEQARAFDRFNKAESARNGGDRLGLALPLAKQFAEAHGGSVTLYSEPGAGTVVSIELPR